MPRRYAKKTAVKRRPRIGKARPMRKLKLNYRSINSYRFMRETMPQTATFTLIPSANYGAIGYMDFDNLQFSQLPGYSEFQNLFARYKVDKIVTTLTPMWQQSVYEGIVPTNSSQLEITRVSTKYMNADFPILANSDLQLAELAQLQAKSKSLYAQKKPLVLITNNPGVIGNSVVNSAGNEVNARRTSPWLSLSGPNASIDVPFKHNSIIFAARVDGQSLTTAWKYRVTHKVIFRCSQVG